ncbi:extensin family protein [Aestuariibius insulae]|uniref:extensin-like domain-containing protein n=1 Tax=Aestuariibius insulae TaxID=2058287 RepID=UPI00345E9CD3
MRAALVLICLAGPLLAQDLAPDTSLTPMARPDPEDREEIVAPEAQDALTPPVRVGLTETDDAFEACLADLDNYRTVYETRDAVSDPSDGDCGITRPVMVSEIVPGLTLQPDAMMRCETAVALAEWTARIVLPAAEMMEEKGAVTGIDHGSTYICRRRNNAATGKLSEHSFGNAVDVMGFRFEDGTSLAIEPRADAGTIEEAFQRAVRGGACLSFTTVLGPGTDATHDDHLHLDVKSRKGGYRICQ